MNRTIVKGFTLIEVAIVLAIVAMVIGGLAVPISKHLVDQQYTDTQTNIDKAVEAVIGFAILNRRLPCPDINTSATAIDNRDGVEDFTSTAGLITGCSTNGTNTGKINYTNATDVNGGSWGDLPWQTLGLSAPNNADAWSNRLRYAVFTPLVTQSPQIPVSGVSPVCTGVGFANLTCTTTNNSITALLDIRCTNPNHPDSTLPPGCLSTTAPAYTVSTNAVFVVYSMGANGWGSTNINTATVNKPFALTSSTSIPTPAIWDQWANGPELAAYSTGNGTPLAAANIATRRQFVIRPRTDTTSASGEFDDLMSFVSSNSLVIRLLNAGVYP